MGDIPKVDTHSHSSLLVTPQPDVQSQCHSSASSSLSSSAGGALSIGGVASLTVGGMVESVIYYHPSEPNHEYVRTKLGKEGKRIMKRRRRSN
jgi:hypothetical protein